MEGSYRKYELSGIQLFADRKENAFLEQYAVFGVPRYIFLDPQGRIIDYNAPRPSETKAIHAMFKRVGLSIAP